MGLLPLFQMKHSNILNYHFQPLFYFLLQVKHSPHTHTYRDSELKALCLTDLLGQSANKDSGDFKLHDKIKSPNKKKKTLFL